MQICLIRPSIVIPANNITSMFTPPVGLAYVAGTLRDAGFDVRLIDGVGEALDVRQAWPNDCFLYGLGLEEIVARIPAGARIIGISAGFSFEWPTCRQLVGMIRQRFPDALLVGGGEHVTAMPAESLMETDLDIGVLGEGEETILEIAEALRDDALDPADVMGIVYRGDGGGIVETPRRPRRRDLDDIPWPAWDLIPMEGYLSKGYGFGVNRGRSMPLIASRGCPYQCTFCSNPGMWTTRWVARGVDDLLSEIEYYQRIYRATNFDFYDLTAIVKKKWIVEFCEKIAERGLKFTWQLPSGTRTEAIDAEVARLLHRSGCRNMSYSPESGSPSVLERIKKKISTDSVIASIRSAVGEGMNIKTNIMFGFPGETPREVLQSYRFIVRMALAGAHDLSIWAFSPYPGSELFDRLRADGRIVIDDAYYDSLRSYADTSRTRSHSAHFSDRQLKALRYLGLMLFYGTSWLRRPRRPFTMLLNVYRGTHQSRAEMGLANLLRRRRMAADPRET